MKYLFATLTLLCVLAACAVAPQTPAQTIYAIDSKYNAALTLAVAYKRLPKCGPMAPTLCSDPKILARVMDVDDTAYALLSAAQNTVRTGGDGSQMAIAAAEQAVLALTSIVATLGVK